MAESSFAYGEPEGGWIYTFNGDSAEEDLDGTWKHDNGSDAGTVQQLVTAKREQEAIGSRRLSRLTSGLPVASPCCSNEDVTNLLR